MDIKGESNINIVPIVFLVLLAIFGIFIFVFGNDDSKSDGAVVGQQTEQNKPEPIITPFTNPDDVTNTSGDASVEGGQVQNPGQIPPIPSPQEKPQEEPKPSSDQYSSPPEMSLKDGVDYSAVIKTNKGNINIDLFEEDVPVTVNNFVFLSKEGFYDSTKSHRIIENFMVQFGDPLTADNSMKGVWGTGGPGYKFEDEPFEGEYDRGVVAMANSGPDTNGSQFFIMHGDKDLPQSYVIFGVVSDEDSLDVIDKIAATPVEASKNGEESLPLEDVIINKINIIEGGTSFGP